jgi:hypothetical protein
VLVEFAGWTCPLTPPENRSRRAVGEAGYVGGYIDHYLWPLLYPAGLTREGRRALGAGVLLRRRRHRRASRTPMAASTDGTGSGQNEPSQTNNVTIIKNFK